MTPPNPTLRQEVEQLDQEMQQGIRERIPQAEDIGAELERLMNEYITRHKAAVARHLHPHATD